MSTVLKDAKTALEVMETLPQGSSVLCEKNKGFWLLA